MITVKECSGCLLFFCAGVVTTESSEKEMLFAYYDENKSKINKFDIKGGRYATAIFKDKQLANLEISPVIESFFTKRKICRLVLDTNSNRIQDEVIKIEINDERIKVLDDKVYIEHYNSLIVSNKKKNCIIC